MVSLMIWSARRMDRGGDRLVEGGVAEGASRFLIGYQKETDRLHLGCSEF